MCMQIVRQTSNVHSWIVVSPVWRFSVASVSVVAAADARPHLNELRDYSAHYASERAREEGGENERDRSPFYSKYFSTPILGSKPSG